MHREMLLWISIDFQIIVKNVLSSHPWPNPPNNNPNKMKSKDKTN